MRGEVRDALRQDRDPGDLWGWAMGHRFGIADALHVVAPDAIPAGWEYRPAIGLDREAVECTDPDSEWLELLDADDAQPSELVHAGNVLQRYCRVLERAGRDY